ncbi:hypothetical protein JXO59_01560, partial [candidate division KSB1 bacterium]|nr:hypothetical protein [candidate division KSB1 bacterium]
MSKDSEKWTTIQMEKASMRLLERLQRYPSSRLTQHYFINFFKSLRNFPDQTSLQTYYLQFESWLPNLCAGLFHPGWSPAQLEQLLAVVEEFVSRASDGTIAEELIQVRQKVREAAALSYLYVGEPDKVTAALGWPSSTVHEISARGMSMTEVERARAWRDGLGDVSIPIDLNRLVEKWFASQDQGSECGVHILLREETVEEGRTDAAGILSFLHGYCTERPGDAEEDRVSLLNQAPGGEKSLHWSLLDALAALRASAPRDRSFLAPYYSLQLSLPEKEAEFSGNSIGLAAAVLAYCLILKRYYRAPLARLAQSTAITGRINSDGRVLPVEESGLTYKLSAAFFSPIKRALLPEENLVAAVRIVDDLRRQYPNRQLTVEGVTTLSQALENRNVVYRRRLTAWRRSVAAFRRRPAEVLRFVLPSLLAVLLFFLIRQSMLGSRALAPAGFQIEGSELRIFNAEQKWLWSHDFKVQLTKINYDPQRASNVVIADIDDDGRQDVLYGGCEENDAELSGRLFVFDHKGKIKWRHKVGRELLIGGQVYKDHYRIHHLRPRDLDRDGRKEIIINAFQYPNFPCLVQALDCMGRLQGEYVHIGYLPLLDFYDFDDDGHAEILLGGMNNEYQSAVLAVLDASRLGGCSPQTPGSRFFPESLRSGLERAYLRFPHTEFVALGNSDHILEIEKSAGGLTVVNTNVYPNAFWSIPLKIGMVYYHFDRSLRLTSEPILGDVYKSLLATRFNMPAEKIDRAHYRRV